MWCSNSRHKTICFGNAWWSRYREIRFQERLHSSGCVLRLCRFPSNLPILFLSLRRKYISLQFGDELILSAKGVQQGDPSGPLLFCLAIQLILRSLPSYLRIGYMDDLTLGGDIESVSADVELIAAEGEAKGLELNHSKCELIHASGPAFPSSNITAAAPMRQDSGLRRRYMALSASHCGLVLSLGGTPAPLTRGPAMDRILNERCTELERFVGRLNLISAQDALFILRAAYSSPKILNALRSAPCVEHPAWLASWCYLINNQLMMYSMGC